MSTSRQNATPSPASTRARFACTSRAPRARRRARPRSGAARCAALGRRGSGAEASRPRRRSAARCGRTRKAEGIATERDRKKVREAAEMLVAGDDHAQRGRSARERSAIIKRRRSRTRRVGSSRRWSTALVERRRSATHSAREESRRVRRLSDAHARRPPRRSPHRAVRAIGSTGATPANTAACSISSTPRCSPPARSSSSAAASRLIVACAAPKIVLGRDPLCDLPLRAGGVSRQHAEIERTARRLPAARSRLAQRHLGRGAAARRQSPARRHRQVRPRRRMLARVRDARRHR